jgi:hypothetical protein
MIISFLELLVSRFQNDYCKAHVLYFSFFKKDYKSVSSFFGQKICSKPFQIPKIAGQHTFNLSDGKIFAPSRLVASKAAFKRKNVICVEF